MFGKSKPVTQSDPPLLGLPLGCPECAAVEHVALMPLYTLHQGGERRPCGNVVQCARCGHVHCQAGAGTFRYFRERQVATAEPQASGRRERKPADEPDESFLKRAGILP